MSCRLPVELIIKNIVRAVVQCGDVESLANMALACHAVYQVMRPHLFRRVIVDSPERCHALLDFVQQYGPIGDGIQSLTMQQRENGSVHLFEAIPIPLLSLLQNLRRLRWLEDGTYEPDLRSVSIHPGMLTRIRIHLSHIDTLHLEHVDFVSVNEFARLLLAFTGLRNLRLTAVDVRNARGLSGTLKARLSASPCLRSLEIDCIENQGILAAAFEACLDTLTNFTIVMAGHNEAEFDPDGHLLAFITRISQFHEITLPVRMNSNWGPLTNEIKLLRLLRPENCNRFVVILNIDTTPWEMHKHDSYDLNNLHRALLDCGVARITYRARGTRKNEDVLWRLYFSRLFNPLSQAPRVKIDYDFLHEDDSGRPTLCGHSHGSVQAISMSSDGRWVATASKDAVILWDGRGQFVRHWRFSAGFVLENSKVISQDLVIVNDLKLGLTFHPLQSLSFPPYPTADGELPLAVDGRGATVVLDLYNVKYLAVITRKQLHCKSHWLPDGRSLALLDMHGSSAYIWTKLNRSGEGYKLHRILDLSPSARREGYLRQGFSSVFPNHNNDVLFGFRTRYGCHIWNMTTKKEDFAFTSDDYLGDNMTMAINPAPGPLCVAIATLPSSSLVVWTQVRGDDRKKWAQETAELPSSSEAVHLAFSGDGRTLIACTVMEDWTVHSLVYTMRACSGTEAAAVVMQGFELMSSSAHHLLSLQGQVLDRTALSPRGTYIACAVSDGGDDSWNVHLYRACDGKLLVVFREPGYPGVVKRLTFSPDEELLVFSLEDGSVLFRRIRNFFFP